jgi:glucoside 3-dehydrogenase (cytochrome c) hitch-hiker subunit
MDRRQALSRISTIVGGSISIPTLASVMSGCSRSAESPANNKYVPRILSREQYAAVQIVVDAIIPRTDTPGALDVGADRFIDTLLADYFSSENKTNFLYGLDWFLETTNRELSPDFVGAAEDDRLAFLMRMDQAAYNNLEEGQSSAVENAFFRHIKELVLVGYYTSEEGATTELHVAPYGAYHGDVSFESIGKTWA